MRACLVVIILTVLTHPISAQNSKVSPRFGIKYSFVHHVKLYQHVPSLTVELGRHNLSLGASFSRFLKPISDPVDTYDNWAKGFQIGYRYSIGNNEKFKPFVQFYYAVVNQAYHETQHGLPRATENTRWILMNTLSFGLSYNAHQHFSLFSGIGFGSLDGFVFILNRVIPSAYVGIELRL